MFGTLETKDLAQVAVSITGVAILFIYFNRRLNSMKSSINELSESMAQRDAALQDMGRAIQSMNDKMIVLERQNSTLRQQIASLPKPIQQHESPPQRQMSVYDMKPEERQEVRRRPTPRVPPSPPSVTKPAPPPVSPVSDANPSTLTPVLEETGETHTDDIESVMSEDAMDTMLHEELKDLAGENGDDPIEEEDGTDNLKKTL